MSDDGHIHGRIDRLEQRFDKRLDQFEERMVTKLDQLSDEVSTSRGRERERARWIVTLTGFVSAAGAALVAWALGLIGK